MKWSVYVRAIGGWTLHSQWRTRKEAVDQADMVHGVVRQSAASDDIEKTSDEIELSTD